MIEELNFSFEPRLMHQHLGTDKYTSALTALAELVANALQASATRVEVVVETSDLGAVRRVVVADNGSGMSRQVITDRFLHIGVDREADASIAKLGRFGVGRLAVFRIGTRSSWTTIARGESSLEQVKFVLDKAELAQARSQKELVLKIETQHPEGDSQTGTTIDIMGTSASDDGDLTPTRISEALLKQFCSYLLTHKDRQVFVNGEPVDPTQLIETEKHDEVSGFKGSQKATLKHLLLRRSVKEQRLGGNLLMCAKGRTVHEEHLETPPSDRYLGILECAYLDELVTSNREGVRNLDKSFLKLLQKSLNQIETYAQEVKTERRRAFLLRARQEKFYPYKGSQVGVAQIEQAVYDVALETLNEHVRVEGMTVKQKEVVFGLLRRSLDNSDLLDVLAEVVKLSDKEVAQFREVLERTTLDAVVHLASEVTDRLSFISVLHDVTYGDISKRIRERSQLHRMLERHCWLFGPQFHLSASDRSFRSVIARYREEAGWEPLNEEVLKSIDGVQRIPDLFLAARKDYPHDGLVRHLLVELKRPTVQIGQAELQQVKDYGLTLLAAGEFDRQTTRWDVFILSSEVKAELEEDRKQKGRPFGCVFETGDERLRIWIKTWGEIIGAAREELHLVRKHLETKMEDVQASAYLKKQFGELFEPDELSSQQS